MKQPKIPQTTTGWRAVLFNTVSTNKTAVMAVGSGGKTPRFCTIMLPCSAQSKVMVTQVVALHSPNAPRFAVWASAPGN